MMLFGLIKSDAAPYLPVRRGWSAGHCAPECDSGNRQEFRIGKGKRMDKARLKVLVVQGNNVAILTANLCGLVAVGSFIGILLSPGDDAAKHGFWYAVIGALAAGVVVAGCQRWLRAHFPSERSEMLARARQR